MAEDKQLTVAEILARAQKENPEAGARRRRRRSLEEGGVSVAELTGSIKKVEAKPTEARHSSIPIDAPEDPAPETPASAQPVRAEQPKPAAKQAAPTSTPAAKPEVKKVEATKPEVKKAKGPKPEVKKPEPARASSDETAVIKKVTTEPAAKAPSAQSTNTAAPAASAAPKAAAPKTATPNTAAPAAPAAAAAETAEVERVAVQPAEVQRTEMQRETEPDYIPADEIEVEEAGVNPIVLVLLVFFGVLLGVLGFLGFRWLWENTSAVVASVLGAATVIAALIAARAVGTGRDWLSIGLAGIAAAVVAFGPALM